MQIRMPLTCHLWTNSQSKDFMEWLELYPQIIQSCFSYFFNNAIQYRINTFKIVDENFIISFEKMPHCTLEKRLKVTF